MQQSSQPNIVPLCDILLVLIIIFMVITPLTSKGFDIKMPDLAKGQSDQIVVTLEKNGDLKINQETYRVMEEFKLRLEEVFRYRVKKVVFFKADERVLYKNVIKIIDVVKGAGIDVVSVMPLRYESGQADSKGK